MRGQRVGNLTGGVLVLFGHVGKHPAKQGHIQRLAAVEDFFQRLSDLGIDAFGRLLLSLAGFFAFGRLRLGDRQGIPPFMNHIGNSRDFPLTEEKQVFGLATILDRKLHRPKSKPGLFFRGNGVPAFFLQDCS